MKQWYAFHVFQYNYEFVIWRDWLGIRVLVIFCPKSGHLLPCHWPAASLSYYVPYWWLTPRKYVFICIFLWLCVWEECVIILLDHGQGLALDVTPRLPTSLAVGSPMEVMGLCCLHQVQSLWNMYVFLKSVRPRYFICKRKWHKWLTNCISLLNDFSTSRNPVACMSAWKLGSNVGMAGNTSSHFTYISVSF